jgi:serine/threonine protein kinase
MILKLADFGISRVLNQTTEHTTNVMGTLSYMAPECFEGSISKKSDVYAFAMTMCEIYTLAPLFVGSPFIVMKKICDGVRPIITDELDAEVAAMIRSCWFTAAADRPLFEDLLKTVETMKRAMPVSRAQMRQLEDCLPAC